MLQTSTIVDPTVHEDSRPRTLGQHLDGRLTRLLRSMGQQDKLLNALAVAHVLTKDWRDRHASLGPEWPSDITDDHTPFEFSLALNGTSETLRILTEPQDPKRPSLAANWRNGAAINEELASRWGARLEMYGKVADLFAPGSTAEGRFSIWQSAILGGAEAADFKVYLNPAIHGVGNADSVLAAALGRLNLSRVWQGSAPAVLARRGLDELMYFSLDLAAAPHARVKIYVAHRNATARDLSRALSGSPGFDASNTSRWLQQLLGGVGPFTERPPISCFALCPGSLEVHSTTLHLPVRCYLNEDFEIARRVCKFLTFPQRVRFMRALTGLAERPLESGRGLQTYVSLRASPGRQAVTVYLAPQVYSVAPTRTLEAPAFFGAGEAPMLEHAS